MADFPWPLAKGRGKGEGQEGRWGGLLKALPVRAENHNSLNEVTDFGILKWIHRNHRIQRILRMVAAESGRPHSTGARVQDLFFLQTSPQATVVGKLPQTKYFAGVF